MLLVSLGVLAVSSCVKEGFSNGEEADMMLSVMIPDGVVTKAYGDGKYADINLIVGVCGEDGNEKFRKNCTLEKGNFETTVPIRLVIGKKYQLVLWAQYGDAYGNPTTMPLDAISMDYSASNKENKDAFYAHVPVFEVRQDFSQSVVLRRPFAQLNFATRQGDIDLSLAEGHLGLSNAAAVTISSVANRLNLLTGEATYVDPVSSEVKVGAKVTVPATAFPKGADGKYPTIQVEKDIYEILSMNYLLVADSQSADGKTTVDLTLTVGELTLDVPSVQLKRNWRTNIVGQLLTAEGTFKVSIEPDFQNVINQNWNPGN